MLSSRVNPKGTAAKSGHVGRPEQVRGRRSRVWMIE
jgi:hypothetical protein